MEFSTAAYVLLLREYRGIPWSLSRKRKKNHVEYYRQYTENGKRVQTYVRKQDVPEILTIYERKMQLKEALREMKTKLEQLPPLEKKEARAQIHMFRALKIVPRLSPNPNTADAAVQKERTEREERDVAIDGTPVRSRAEIICHSIAELFGLKVHYEEQFYTGDQLIRETQPYLVDFTFTDPETGKKIYWEHFGKIHDKAYRDHQRKKIGDYRINGLKIGKDLVITSSGDHFNAPLVLWKLICGGLISAVKARRLYRRIRNDLYYDEQEENEKAYRQILKEEHLQNMKFYEKR